MEQTLKSSADGPAYSGKKYTSFLLPDWANKNDFTRQKNGEYVKFTRRSGVRRAIVIYRGKLHRVVLGVGEPWVWIRKEIGKTDRRGFRKQPAKTRSRSSVTYEFLYARIDLAKRRSAKKDMPFNLTVKDLYEVGDAQRWRCALTGIAFDCEKGAPWANPYTLSIDRIDCSRGYERENIRLVIYAMNVALGTWGEDTFEEICKSFLNKRKGSARHAK